MEKKINSFDIEVILFMALVIVSMILMIGGLIMAIEFGMEIGLYFFAGGFLLGMFFPILSDFINKK